MKPTSFLYFLKAGAATVFLGGLSASLGNAKSFEQSLAQAYQNNPNFAVQKNKVRSAFEAKKAIIARGWLPTINGTTSVTEQASHTKTKDTSGHTGSSSIPIDMGITLSQPILNGGTTSAELRAADQDIQAAKEEFKANEQNFLLDAIRIYFSYITAEAQLNLAKNQVRNYEKDLDYKKAEFEVGAVSQTELAAVEARLSEARANQVKSEVDLQVAQADYVRVFGEAPQGIKFPPLPRQIPATLEETSARAERLNPTLLRAILMYNSNTHTVAARQGELLPSLSITGNIKRSLTRPSEETNPLTLADTQTNSASLVAQVSIPLYNPATFSRIRDSIIAKTQARLSVEDARRQLKKNITQVYYNLRLAQAMITQYTAAIQAAKIALKGTKEEERSGARTFLDVLIREWDVLRNEVALIEATQRFHVAHYELLSIVGELSPKRLGLPITSFDPERDYNQNAEVLGFKDSQSL